MNTTRLALFAATSGHSGVDRVLINLVTQFDAWGIETDLLTIANHGPAYPFDELNHARHIALNTRHVTSALPGLIRYMRRERPAALLTDKDRVNRLAIIANQVTGQSTRVVVRIGTVVSTNLAARNWLDRQVQRLSMQLLYSHAHAVIVPAIGVANDLAQFAQLSPAHIQVVRSPIITPRLFTLAAAELTHPWLIDPTAPPVILGVGELSERKDFATLIRAVAKVRQQRMCRLMILGRGRRADQLRCLAATLGISDDFALLGFQANPYPFMRQARLFVLSSRWEGLPVALVEALATHTPAIATACPGGGAAEVLENSNCGALVPVGDLDALATAIAIWLDRQPSAADFEATLAPYQINQSARAYLQVLGMTLP
ncbi:glycosyltransferase [Rhodoferax sp. 4810]|uniref:Glycosyltransferase n=1 Tax=Thiospirillum jenense TaxID=1653858 RepID=A0A839H7T4_9GAMM|nr:glycosyltransferase [Thiospirillum jenense]MBB1073841.1 glycosyltransferase [Rhodoferax jenense]MBB1125204.1 glycosyltransferase [Thiospirillum jenense]